MELCKSSINKLFIIWSFSNAKSKIEADTPNAARGCSPDGKIIESKLF